ncbi:RING/U-box superfamily protein, putative isoform 1 [Hibiscus syriacus]|uniref:RING/U-box superfamily protein, putative isoform 1 n=1 Tax=Hibiscus syriacus TaxID=106335 RepID=A0A6A3CRB0_HIBSY|nr:RING/U-box superfamily protein, putative isoform 1 [Hibiscus syriacus]
MATRTVGLIQNQDLNARFNGKTNVSKAQRKAGTGGRKPLGDLSISVKSSNKENAKSIPFIEKEIGIFNPTHDSSKTKSVYKAEKVQATARKALSDISNSGKPYSQGTSKKNQKAKLGNPDEDRCQLEDIAEEGCLHNHEDCIKTQKRAISTNEFLRILGLDDFSKHSASAKEYSLSNILEPMSPPRYAESNKMTEMLIEEPSPPKHMLFWKFRLFCS